MSDKKPEVSPGGSEILRHEARERDWTAPPAVSGMEEIEQHFTTFFGEPTNVFHEIISDLVHLDVHVIPPSPERDCWTLFTTGMSDLPMTVPEGAEDFRFAELVLMLPREWKLDMLRVTPPPEDLDRWYWPIRWLKQLARLPHEYQTWLGFGHTVPNGDPPQPLSPETKMCGWFLVPPISVPEEGRSVVLADGRTVHFYCLHCLHIEEMNLKLNRGSDALLDAFDQAGIGEILQLERRSAVRQKLFGLF
jgi:hypothetical protein